MKINQYKYYPVLFFTIINIIIDIYIQIYCITVISINIRQQTKNKSRNKYVMATKVLVNNTMMTVVHYMYCSYWFAIIRVLSERIFSLPIYDN